MSRFYSISSTIALIALFFVLQQGLLGQGEALPERSKTTVYPTELYPGENVLTFYNPDGIKDIEPMFDSLTTSMTELEMLDTVSGCSDSVIVRLKVKTGSPRLSNRFMVTSCKKKRQVFVMQNRVWYTDMFVLPDIEAGDTSCQKFWAGRAENFHGEGEFIESITASAPQVFFSYHPDSIPPLYRSYEHVYFYSVCFVADIPGDYNFHVMHRIRRDQPAGGHTTFVVADTGVVRVLPRESEEIPSPGETR